MLVFIAGPGNTMPFAFDAARGSLESAGYDTRLGFTAFFEDPDDPLPPRWHGDPDGFPAWQMFARDDLDECDAVALLAGWSRSPGASLEYGYAVGAGIPVFPLRWWIERTPAAAATKIREIHRRQAEAAETCPSRRTGAPCRHAVHRYAAAGAPVARP